MGEAVIYRLSKQSPHPGPRAHAVRPNLEGESYSYSVDKLWVVREVRPDGQLLLQTRRGKQHLVNAADDQLRRPSLWDRWVHRGRFPSLS